MNFSIMTMLRKVGVRPAFLLLDDPGYFLMCLAFETAQTIARGRRLSRVRRAVYVER